MPDTSVDRIKLNNEWHARPSVGLPAPCRCSLIVELRGEGSGERDRAELAAFCAAFGKPQPPADARHHLTEAGSCIVKWERHSEATNHTIFVPGNGQPPFAESALDFLAVEKRQVLLERMFVGVHIEVLRRPEDDVDHGFSLARSLLGSDAVFGGWMSDRHAAVWSAYKLDSHGFIRILIMDVGISEERLARLIQRLLDIETYRMLAMRAFPRAREIMEQLGALEPELADVMRELAEEPGERLQEELLRRITSIAARVEHIASTSGYRFAAARAYHGIVERRVQEVREEVLHDHQRLTNFMEKSLVPAMRTCEAAERRTNELALKVSRAANLLDTMVDMVQKKQSQAILQSMEQRVRLQVRLQQAFEGFSIAAISYYTVGMIAYILKAAKRGGLSVDPEFVSGLSVPIVIALCWFAVRAVTKRVTRRSGVPQ
jgi:uncharacterized membrane-anchored protein